MTVQLGPDFTGSANGVYKAILIAQASAVAGCNTSAANATTPFVTGVTSKCTKTDNFKIGDEPRVFELNGLGGKKFNDANANGVWDNGELPLESWEIHIVGTKATAPFEETVFTDSNGAWATSLDNGTKFTVCEVLQASWNQSYPVKKDDVIAGGTVKAVDAQDSSHGPLCWEGTVGVGLTDVLDFGNWLGKDLTISKTAAPTFTRTYSWQISKDVDKTLISVNNGANATFNYTVKVDQTGFTDSDWVVTGKITVTNPNPVKITGVNITDAVDNGGVCSVLSGANQEIGAGASVEYSYSCTYASAPSPLAGTNTATATWSGTAFNTPNTTKTGTAGFEFKTPTTTVNKTVTVKDTFDGTTETLGTVTATDATPYASKTFNYSKTIKASVGICKEYANTAEIDETDQTASETVTVCGNVTGGLTIGFWQNKNGQEIITTGAATANVCNSGTWLREFAPFKDLSATAKCSEVGTYVTNVIKAASCTSSANTCNAMLKAQMLATALDVYFSNPALGGNKIGAPSPIGGIQMDLTKVCFTIGSCAGSYGDVSSAFGGASKLTVMQMLTYAASQSNMGGSTWYGQVKAIQVLAKNAFDAINNGVAFVAP